VLQLAFILGILLAAAAAAAAAARLSTLIGEGHSDYVER